MWYDEEGMARSILRKYDVDQNGKLDMQVARPSPDRDDRNPYVNHTGLKQLLLWVQSPQQNTLSMRFPPSPPRPAAIRRGRYLWMRSRCSFSPFSPCDQLACLGRRFHEKPSRKVFMKKGVEGGF